MFVNTIDPILFHIGPFGVRYYGLFLALGVILSALILKKLFAQKGESIELMLDMITWLIIGGFIGARFGHVFFYRAEYFLQNPIEILFVHHGGLASHGMTIGLLITTWIYGKAKRIEWKNYLDMLIIPIPLIAALIRLGNFTNSEIVGRPTDGSWGVLFPLFEKNPILRHPSQLYEAGVALCIFFILLWMYKKYGSKVKPYFLTHLFIFLYFATRFTIEFFKEPHKLPPDAPLTMGQWLSLPFIIYSLWWFYKMMKPR